MGESNWPQWLPVRDDLRDQHPYGAPQLDVTVRLNTNENPYALPGAVVDEIQHEMSRIASDLNRYPDRDALELRASLAAYLTSQGAPALTVGQVWAANGSNEIIQQIFMAFGGRDRCAIGFVPSYSMHSNIARSTQTTWIDGERGPGFSLNAEFIVAQATQASANLVFLTSPNNPTGTSLDPTIVLAVATALPSALIVVDEAYGEFLRDRSKSALGLVSQVKNLVVSRTMSKAFGLAGARVGYLVADEAVVDAIQLVRLPYHLGAHTQSIALVALRHAPLLLENVERIKEQRDRIVAELTAMGLAPEPSDANFVLFGGLADAAKVWSDLVERDVLVRDVGLAGMLRVTAGTQEETTIFLDSLRAIINDKSANVTNSESKG
ncbi:MAG: histidinol-phosphate transaminase [Actinomycetes bacterium]